MGEYCENKMSNSCGGGCNFDLDMVLWVLIIIVIVTCVCD